MSKKVRGFEPVVDAHRQHYKDVNFYDMENKRIYPTVELPVRGDSRSAGYDLFSPTDLMLLPAQKTIIWLDIKAYMQEDEVLKIYPRSSMGIKRGLMLSNTVGVIDSSYYENEGNDGNIGLAIVNTSGVGLQIRKGDRIAQGIFQKYLVADNDVVLSETREGGMGSTGK